MRLSVIPAGILAASLAFVPAASAEMKHAISAIAGWDPPNVDMKKLSNTVDAYFAALKEGRDEVSFRLRTAARNSNDPLETFRKRRAELSATAGALVSMDLGTAAWSKETEVIVTLDFSGRLEKAERYCGLLVIERTPDQDYRIAHDFEVVMTDAEGRDSRAFVGRRGDGRVDEAGCAHLSPLLTPALSSVGFARANPAGAPA